MQSVAATRHSGRLRLVRTLIERHYDTPITLGRMSQEAALSPYHLIRLFRSAYRQTPHQYLVQRRIEKAKELLRSGDLPITEVCSAVGFESLGSFSALFRKMVGLSPSAYRERSSAAYAAAPSGGAPIPLCYRLKHGIDAPPDE